MRGIREGEGEIRDAMPTSSVDEPPIKYASETTTPPERVEEDDQSVVSKFEEEMGAGTKIFKDDSAETSDIEETSTNLDPFEELVPQETDDPKQGKGPKDRADSDSLEDDVSRGRHRRRKHQNKEDSRQDADSGSGSESRNLHGKPRETRGRDDLNGEPEVD